MEIDVDQGNLSDFDDFSLMQHKVLPDVQKLDQRDFENLIQRKEIIFTRSPSTGRITGFSIMKDNGDHGLLRQLAIHPDFRRKGLGKKLVEASEEWFVKRNIKLLKIWVKEDNVAAIDLYKNFNYTKISQRHQYVIDWNEFLDTNLSVLKFDYELRELGKSDDQLVSSKYPITLNELDSFRDLESSISLGVFEKGEIRGFMRLRPDFPVLTPIFLDRGSHLLMFLTLLKKYTNPKFETLKITVEDPDLISFLEFQYWISLNFILVSMSKKLEI